MEDRRWKIEDGRWEIEDKMKFEELEAWQSARELTKQVYGLTQTPELARDFGLTGQIQRASVSIMSNTAEGFERAHLQEKPLSANSHLPSSMLSPNFHLRSPIF